MYPYVHAQTENHILQQDSFPHHLNTNQSLWTAASYGRLADAKAMGFPGLAYSKQGSAVELQTKCRTASHTMQVGGFSQEHRAGIWKGEEEKWMPKA